MNLRNLGAGLSLSFVIGASACGSEGSSEPETAPSAQAATRCPRSGVATVDTFRELMIVHPSVIGDARASSSTAGPWSFRFLAEQMAPLGVDPADFVKRWLEEWKVRTQVNGFAVVPRTRIQGIIDTWPKTAAGKLDLSRSPFRLMAIVNRMDLRSAAKPNGEGRFVFSVLTPPGPGGQFPRSFTVIFEFNLPADGGQTAGVWADRWHALGTKKFGATYNDALQALTNAFAKRGSHPAGVNGSSISQVRANEIDLDSPWELREFHLDSASGMLLQATTGNSPDVSFRDVAGPLTTWINDPANRSAILAQTHDLPARFLGGQSQSDGIPWAFPDVEEPLRKAVATQTCNGCHNGEVEQIDGFYHISPSTPPGTAGQNNLSPFLKNVDLPGRKVAFQNVLCPQIGVATDLDGTPVPPKSNGRVH